MRVEVKKHEDHTIYSHGNVEVKVFAYAFIPYVYGKSMFRLDYTWLTPYEIIDIMDSFNKIQSKMRGKSHIYFSDKAMQKLIDASVKVLIDNLNEGGWE